jgi:trk system potassium uptake protein TrkH
MNLPLLAKHLGTICLLIGGTMVFSLPWAYPSLGHRNDVPVTEFERSGFMALIYSIIIAASAGLLLKFLGRNARGKLFRREAMAIVGLSWVGATLLGGLPFYLSDTYRGPSLRLGDPHESLQLFAFRRLTWGQWLPKDPLPDKTHALIRALAAAGARGLTAEQLEPLSPHGHELLTALADDPDWDAVLLFPGEPGPEERVNCYRIRWVQMTFVDALFESQSGFSTTGATVLSDLEDPKLVAHCILFWRSMTHFLGGLGIIVLFVVILGHGSTGKAMMRAEMPGPSKEGVQSRMQHTAWLFAGVYVALNIILTVLLKLAGLTWFDALCHAFGTMATGGFSTYNASLGHFNSPLIDYLVIAFMGLAGTNFVLLYFCLLGQPKRLLNDTEWRTYFGLIVFVTVLVIGFGMAYSDFRVSDNESRWQELQNAVRYGLFQVVSIITTTGYGTHDFDGWNSFGRGILFLLMFVGGCAGSTGGGLKVIRHVLFLKILKLEIEHSFHPTVVRPLKLGGKPVETPDLRKSVLVYFSLILVLFSLSWLAIITIEPDLTWGNDSQHKLLDTATAISATLNNIGPGLGTVGATQNYGHFSAPAKILFTWLMMLGRVEIYAILVLALPGFWRGH